MSKDVNKIAFDFTNEEEVKLFHKILDDIIELSRNSDNYFDIRIRYEDCGIVILEFAQVPFDRSYGGEFRYIAEDECVFKEVILPDNTIQYAPDEETAKEILDEWKLENPGYETNNF